VHLRACHKNRVAKKIPRLRFRFFLKEPSDETVRRTRLGRRERLDIFAGNENRAKISEKDFKIARKYLKFVEKVATRILKFLV
jgi:hypothetical protein